MVNNLIQNIHLVQKPHYADLDKNVTVGGHYLNELLLNNNNNLKGGGAIYAKLEKYGIPAGLYVSPISNNNLTLHKIETIIVKQYDYEKMDNLHNNLYTGIIKNIHNNTRKKENRQKKEKTRKR
jgi:hypothetical protein